MEEMRNNGDNKVTTTIAIWKSTKDKLDENRAPGQCYNGFICQLVDMWEKLGRERVYSRAGSSEDNHGARVSTMPY